MVLISIKTGAVPINRNHLQSLRGSKINHKMRIPKYKNGKYKKPRKSGVKAEF
jgi:hypothetical protein